MGSPWSQDLYIEALRYAAHAHLAIPMPGGSTLPYLVHLSLVASEVTAALAAEDGLDGDLAAQCALLHDVMEDVHVEFDVLVARFGRPVADGVAALSKNYLLPKAEQMPDSLRRIQAQPRAVWLVKLADRTVNLHLPPAHWSQEKRQRYLVEGEAILEALGPSSPRLAARLRSKIAAYDVAAAGVQW